MCIPFIGMIQGAIHSCCLGCTNISYIGPLDPMERFHAKASVAVPIQTSLKAKQFFDRDFVHVIGVPGVSFFVPDYPPDMAKMTTHLFDSIMNTWPLFLMAFLMAFIAGLVVWVLVRLFYFDGITWF